jgi:hypothetical protein
VFDSDGQNHKEWFYPGTGHWNETGSGEGAGTNLNVVWEEGGMGNTEYAAAFSEVVLPCVLGFRPDLIIVACGLDPAAGDLIGDCNLSPDMFYVMTKSLLEMPLRATPLVVALEGGYNLEIMSSCMEAVTLALLDEPYVPQNVGAGSNDGDEYTLARYWNRSETKEKKTIKAVASIKKSLRAMMKTANGRAILGNGPWIASRKPPAVVPPPKILEELLYRNSRIVPRCHRPFQDAVDESERRQFFDRRVRGSSGDNRLLEKKRTFSVLLADPRRCGDRLPLKKRKVKVTC